MVKEYDILIIGGGPGGYVAAIRGAQLGFKVALIEENKIGGVCLHKGCIPTKTFIKSAEIYSLMQVAEQYGVTCENYKFNLNLIKERTENIINILYKGINDLLVKNKIDVYNFRASLMGASIFSPIPGSVSIPKEDGDSDVIISKNIIIATGTSVTSIPGLTIDKEFVITSNEALKLNEIPESIIIIGGGVIGIEWSSLLNSLGSKVTVLENSSTILPLEDQDISKEMLKILPKKGIIINTNVDIMPDTLCIKDNKVSIKALVDGKKKIFKGSKILVAAGRVPNTKNMGLENTKITFDKRGYIEVDSNFKTKANNIFAIGDVTGFMPLAHVASAAGVYVVEFLKGLNPPKILKENMPRCIYSKPEISSIGITEEEAIKLGIPITTNKFLFLANAKSLIEGEKDGFIKIIVNKETNDLIGMHIIGNKATELISNGAIAKFLDASGLELGKAIYPHPSISEIIGEGALSVYNAAIHKH